MLSVLGHRTCARKRTEEGVHLPATETRALWVDSAASSSTTVGRPKAEPDAWSLWTARREVVGADSMSRHREADRIDSKKLGHEDWTGELEGADWIPNGVLKSERV